MIELCPISDFPFTKSDFTEEFRVYQDQFELFWFDDVEKISICQWNMVEYMSSDVHVLGVKLGKNEFYIGTLNGEWCLHSNLNLRWPFKNTVNSTYIDLYNWIKKEYLIPDEIIYSIIRISKKYSPANNAIKDSNFSSCWSENPKRLSPPFCENCNKSVRKDNYIAVNNFGRCLTNTPWNSGWKGQCEHCNYDYNISLRQMVSNHMWPVERRTDIKISNKNYMDSVDSFMILSGVEIIISETFGGEKKISKTELFISTNELKYIIQKIKSSPLLEQFDWDADCT